MHETELQSDFDKATVHFKLAQKLESVRSAAGAENDWRRATVIGRQVKVAYAMAYELNPNLRDFGPQERIEPAVPNPEPYVWQYEPFNYDQRL